MTLLVEQPLIITSLELTHARAAARRSSPASTPDCASKKYKLRFEQLITKLSAECRNHEAKTKNKQKNANENFFWRPGTARGWGWARCWVDRCTPPRVRRSAKYCIKLIYYKWLLEKPQFLPRSFGPQGRPERGTLAWESRGGCAALLD